MRNRITGLIRKSLMGGGSRDDDGNPPPNQPPPTGPFSRGGAPSAADDRGRIEPSLGRQSADQAPAPQPNVPLTGRQARTLRAAGHEPAEIGAMSPQDRATALREAEAAGFSPLGRITPADRSAMRGALPHIAFDGRSGDGRFASRSDILAHPDINGRVEPTFHPEADATHQAILAHEQRLKDIASKLPPNASVRDITSATKQASDDVLAMVRAYHGTPHEFDRFDLSKIGTGEGAQVFGHGLYFADDEQTARGYQKGLSIKSKAGGNLFQVAIDREPEHFLDHDLPYSEQSPHVRDALDRLGLSPRKNEYLEGSDPAGADLYQHSLIPLLLGEHPGTSLENLFGRPMNELVPGGDLAAFQSKKMSDAGIAGVRYLDGASRDAGNGTRNYVVFNDKDIAITHRNGQPVSDAIRDDVLPMVRHAPRGSEAQPLTLRNAATGAAAQAQAVTPLRDALKQFDITRDQGADMLSRASQLSVGDRISKLLGDTKVFTVGPAEMRTLAEGRMKIQAGHEPAGFYDRKTGHIVVLDDAMRNPREAAHLLIHEGVHGALSRTIDKSPSAQNVIDHLRTTAMAIHFERGGEASDHYGLTNAHEFLSEALSNPHFQRFLASIPADDRHVRAFGLQGIGSGRTMWDTFVGAVRKILGLAPDQHTILDAAMKISGHLFDKAEAEAALKPQTTATSPTPARTPHPAFLPTQGGLIQALSRMS